MPQHSIYLFFNGNCEEAMNFYKDALGGTIESMQRFGDAPMPATDEQKNKIMHASLNIDGANLMFSDSDADNRVNFGNNFSISLNFSTNEEEERVFNILSAEGKITMPLQDTFWGSRFGMCTDKFGVNWMFSTEHKDN